MNWIEDAVAEFGRTMNLDGLVFNGDGLVCLEFEVMGTLYLEHASDGALLVYLARRLVDPSHIIPAACAAHYREGHETPVHVAMSDPETLIFLTRIEAREVTADKLERMMNLLAGLHDRLFEECAA